MLTSEQETKPVPDSRYSYHADRWSSKLFASLWVDAWGDQYPVKAAPFSSCTCQLLEELERQLVAQSTDILVDLGCGTDGVGSCLSQNLDARLIGIDRCSAAIAIAASRASEWDKAIPASFVVADICKTGLASASVDAAVSIDAITAVVDIERALFEVRRILKPKGIFVFTARQLGPGSRHIEIMGPDWCDGLEQNGFENVRVIPRPEVSKLWQSLYHQWLKHEDDLREELQSETVDALLAEARQGIPKMKDGRCWYLIKATATA